MEAAQTALVVLLPETGPAVDATRRLHDAAAAEGVGAHVTILYPFLDLGEIDAPVTQALRDCFAAFPPFSVAFTRLCRFPGSLYLEPDPAEPLRALTLAVWERFPSHPPYGGRHDGIVPHLTLAQLPEEARLDALAEAFMAEAGARLPLVANVAEVTLIARSEGKWRVQTAFPLSGE